MRNYFRILYYLANLMRHSHWQRDQLVRYQDRRLRDVVKYAYDNVPFYRQKFRQLKLKPEEIKGVRDLNKLPVLKKEELLKNAKRIISDRFNIRNLDVESTSGSTGRPLSMYLTGKEEEFRKAKLLRANMCCGQKPRDKWVVITPPQHYSRAASVQRLLGIYAPISVSVFDDAHAQILNVQHLKPNILEGYSSSLLLMSKEAEKSQAEIPTLRMIIGGAELVDDNDRMSMEKAFGVPFYDQYSSVEFDSLAWQCQERNGYHIDADTVIMEFVDKVGDQVTTGEEGEIVCTSLFNYAMPLIRYVIGDVGVLSENNECPCGRTLPLMKVLSGRSDSIIVLPDGRMLSPLVIGDGMMYFKYFSQMDQYRVLQKRADLFRILVKKKANDIDNDVFEAEFSAYFKSLLKVQESEATVEVELVDEIPLDKGGKLRKVVSEIKKSV